MWYNNNVIKGWEHHPNKRKELIKMKVIVYANWGEEEIITEKEYKERLEKDKKNKANFDDYKNSYLNEYIEDFIAKSSYLRLFETVFNFTDAERQKILDEVKEGYENQIEEDFSSEWEEIEIDI